MTRPTCLESSGCLGSSPLSGLWRVFQAAEHRGKFFPLPRETLTFSFRASYTSGLQVGGKDGLSFLGNVWNLPQRAQPGGYSSSLLLQLLAQERAMEPEVRWMSHVRQVCRRKPIPQCSLCLIHRTPCREVLPGSTIIPRWQTAGRAASGMTLSPGCSPHPGQPSAREVPARCCCAWKMNCSGTDIVVCSHTQLHSELFNCTDISEAQTAMPVFFLKWKKEHYIMPILRNTPSLRTTAQSLSQNAWLKCVIKMQGCSQVGRREAGFFYHCFVTLPSLFLCFSLVGDNCLELEWCVQRNFCGPTYRKAVRHPASPGGLRRAKDYEGPWSAHSVLAWQGERELQGMLTWLGLTHGQPCKPIPGAQAGDDNLTLCNHSAGAQHFCMSIGMCTGEKKEL